ncbi:MAG: hypothetical protein IKL75_06720 [Bacteroidaceae bacterium]|nr:hypothetical protein [Bacteroidaceae bacterium]
MDEFPIQISVLIVLAIIGLAMIIAPYLIWNKKYGKKYIDAALLPLRRKYRNVSAFGMLLFIVSVMTLLELVGYLDGNELMWILVPGLFMYNFKIFFEPYYTTDVVDKIDDFCFYLRPFVSDAQYNWNWMNGSLEKVLCGEFNKRIAQCYCIGDPNSAIPTTLSTSGIYASDDEWQDAVNTLSVRSKLILLRVMDTEGCRWEIGQCINKHFEKTIFIVDDSMHFNLLKKYISDKGIDVPDVTIINGKSFIALYYCNGSWCITVLKNKHDIKSLISGYIKLHKELETEIKNRNKIGTILKAPFKSMKISNKWVHYLSFCLSIWYFAFNRWPKLWISIMVTCFLFVFILMVPYALLSAEYIFLLVSLLLFLSWMWLAPRITMAFNRVGSRYLTNKINVVLLKWVAVYYLLLFLLSFCVPSNTNDDNSDIMYTYCDYFVEDILESNFGYKDYVALETHMDSAFNSIYIDEDVRNALYEYNESNDDLSLFLAMGNFYNAVNEAEKKGNQYIGWEITHRFSCSNEHGECIEQFGLMCEDIVQQNAE